MNDYKTLLDQPSLNKQREELSQDNISKETQMEQK